MNFNDYEMKCEYDPEEWSEAALPKLGPGQMKQLGKALNEFRKHEYRGAIREAWKSSKAQDDSVVTSRLEAADGFIEYLANWITVFDEIHNDGAALGVAVSL